MSTSKIKTTNILLIEDEERWISIFKEIIKKAPDLNLVGSAKESRKALEIIESNPGIDLIVMDTELSYGDVWGVELAKIIHKKNPNFKIIFWSVHISHANRTDAKKIGGALGYIDKKVPDDDEIIRVLHEVLKDEKKKWIEALIEKDIADKFTSFEKKLLELLVQKKSHKEIAIDFLKSQYEVLIDKKGEKWVLENYGNFEQYCNSPIDKDHIDQEKEEKRQKEPRGWGNIPWISQPLVNFKKNESKKDNSTKSTRLESRVKTNDTHIANIKNKIFELNNGRKREKHEKNITLTELLQFAIKYFSRVWRGISLDKVIKKQILKDYSEGVTVEQIAEKFGLETNYVVAVLRECKLEIKRLIQKKISLTDIAKKFGLEESDLEKLINKLSNL